MQAVGMDVNVVAGRDMELHRDLLVAEEQPRHMLHFLPVRAAVLARDADVIPAAIAAGHNHQGLPIDR